jgi:ubiquinone/menaquinone biosynthesis C-methylase UbiE
MSEQNELRRIQRVYRKRIDDRLIDRYSLFRPGELYMLQSRERVILSMLTAAGWASLADKEILEVGCGRGHRLADFVRWGAEPDRLCGVDLMPDFVAEARHTYPNFAIVQASGHQLPYPSESFDLVMQSTLFTSIAEASLRRAIAGEMLRVLRPDGMILWYDFRYPNPRNPDVQPIGAHAIRALFPGAPMRLRTVTLLPPLARALAGHMLPLCRALDLVPILRSHYLALIRKQPE